MGVNGFGASGATVAVVQVGIAPAGGVSVPDAHPVSMTRPAAHPTTAVRRRTCLLVVVNMIGPFRRC